MAATGNEVVRLEQLKRLQPQIVSVTSRAPASITLGNGEVVTFSTSDRYDIHLLVRAMYNSFELLQASGDGSSMAITVEAEISMKTLAMKMQGDVRGKIYGVTNNQENGMLQSFDVRSSSTLSITLSVSLITFIGAVIYVE